MLQENIRTFRKAKGWSQQDLAMKLHVVRQTISKWESGLSVPDAQMLLRLADEMGTTAGALLADETAPESAGSEDTQVQDLAAKLEQLTKLFAERMERQRKIRRMLLALLGAAALLVLLYQAADFLYFRARMDELQANASIIGGYDSPTSIYVSAVSPQIGVVLTAGIAAAAAGFGLYKTRRK